MNVHNITAICCSFQALKILTWPESQRKQPVCVFACLWMCCVCETKRTSGNHLATTPVLRQIQCRNGPCSTEILVSWELAAGSEIKAWCWEQLRQLSMTICCHHYAVCLAAPWTANRWLSRCHPSGTALSSFSLAELLNHVAVWVCQALVGFE